MPGVQEIRKVQTERFGGIGIEGKRKGQRKRTNARKLGNTPDMPVSGSCSGDTLTNVGDLHYRLVSGESEFGFVDDVL